MVPVGLTSLSVELACQVLQELHSPGDLYSLIRASSFLYRIFISRKSFVLSQVLLRAIHPDVLSEVRACFEASDIPEIIENQPAESSRKKITDFIHGYSTRDEKQFSQQLRENATSVSLCRLYSTIDYFITDYSSKALKALHTQSLLGVDLVLHKSNEPCFNQQPAFSSTENGRLQRAFFRFEIYRKIFYYPYCSSGLDPLFDEKEQSDLFLALFPPWEIEELACVHHYLVKVLEDVFDEVEDDFVRAISNEVQSLSLPDPSKRSLFPWPFKEEPYHSVPPPNYYSDPPPNDHWADLTELEWYGLRHFEEGRKSSDHGNHIEFLVSRGLPYLRRLLNLKPEDRRDVVISTLNSGTPFLHEALEKRRYRSDTVERDHENQNSQTDKSLQSVSAGWLWATGERWASAVYDEPSNFNLRDQGYVFWDRKRLENLGILGTPREPVPRTQDSPLEYRQRSMMPSAQERLKGAVVPGNFLYGLAANRDHDGELDYDLFGDAMY